MAAEKAEEFLSNHWEDIILRLSQANAKSAGDHLLQRKCFNHQTYEFIIKIRDRSDQVRELCSTILSAGPQSCRFFYEFLKREDPELIKHLESKAGDETDSGPMKAKTKDETDSGPMSKKPKMEGTQRAEADQTQVLEAGNETGSTQIYTYSKLQKHVADPAKSESLVTSLKQRLKEEGMKHVESLLQGLVPKNAIVFNHVELREIVTKENLSSFLDLKEHSRFPEIAIKQFFKKDRVKQTRQESSGTEEEPEEGNDDSRTMQNWNSAESSGTSFTQRSSLSIHNPPQEAQRLETSIGTLTTPSEFQQSDGAVAADGSIASTPTTAATAPAATTAVTAPAATTAATAPAATTAATISARPVAVGGSRPNDGKLKKRQNRQACAKIKLWKTQVLNEWAIKQIPAEKRGINEEEELKKIKDAIIILNNQVHPRYPSLLADHCKVFVDIQTREEPKIIEIVDSTAFKMNGQLTVASHFKVRFHMWVLDISETVVLSKNRPDMTISRDTFEAEEKRYQRYLHEVVVPLFAVYQKVQRESEL